MLNMKKFVLGSTTRQNPKGHIKFSGLVLMPRTG